MAQININGKVQYADLSPAQEVRVKIWELDLLPGGVNDLIFNKVVNQDGTFSGRSTNWNDAEGEANVPFVGRVVAPDVFANLQFEVTFEGVIHKGPFINNALPIILPASFPKPVQKVERDLVQVVFLMKADYNLQEQLLYGFIEAGSGGAVDATLTDDYRRIHRIQGNNATLANLVEKLTSVGSRICTEAIDLVFCTHGHTNSVVFADGVKSMDDVLAALILIPAATRNKFRMVFSTACFGSLHNQMWLNAGFKCASGSEKVYADSEFSLLPFLETWASRLTFNQAVANANTGIIINRGDDIAKEYYRSIGRADEVDDINSHRIVVGNGNMRIYSKP